MLMKSIKNVIVTLKCTLLPSSGLELKTFLSPMECLLSENLPDLGGPVLFMAPYRSQEEPKNEFWWSSKTPQVESGTLLLWPLITRYPIIWGPEQSRGNWGAKIEEARHQWHIKLGQSHRGHRADA